jgi:hypothetical protein
MTERGLTERSIFELAKAFVRATKDYHETVEASWETPTRRIFQRRKERQLLRKVEGLAVELQVRYTGIMSRIYRYTNSGGIPLNDELWQGIHDATWLIVQDRSAVIGDYLTFFGVLWGAYRARMRIPSAASPLKPQFMLLPFVDEMPECEERRILLRAYGFSDRLEVPREDELKTLLRGAFPLLHSQLLRHSEDLEIITDRVASEDMVRGMSRPFNQLRQWVLPNNSAQEV